MNTLTVGSTRSGKTTAKIRKVVDLAEEGETAIVGLDPHPESLVHGIFEQLVARGLEHRVLFDRLSDTKRVLQYRFLRRSYAKDPSTRAMRDDQHAREFM